MFGFGIWEVAVILVVALLVLGPEKLPKVARQLGRSVRELRRAANEFQSAWSSEVEDLDDVRKAGSDVKKEIHQELRAVPTELHKPLSPPDGATEPPAAESGGAEKTDG